MINGKYLSKITSTRSVILTRKRVSIAHDERYLGRFASEITVEKNDI